MDITRFERARILGARALQIALGAPPLVLANNNDSDSIRIAEAEFEKKLIPISILRTLPDGGQERAE